MPRLLRLLPLLLLVLAAPIARAELTADNLLLIVNRNDPNGQRLAEFYQTARQVPPGRILPLNLPINDEVNFSFFEREVIPAVRDFLRKNQLEDKVTCLVTFYGVPLRVGRRVANVIEEQEITYLRDEIRKVQDQAYQRVMALEAEAQKIDPKFKPTSGANTDALTLRAETVLRLLTQSIPAAGNPAAQQARVNVIVDATRLLGGPAAVLRVFASRANAASDDDRARLTELETTVRDATAEMEKLADSRWDPVARKRIRDLARASIGAMGLVRLMEQQLDYLTAANPVASFDSELAMLWWTNYPRDQWRYNLLNHKVMHARGPNGELPPRTLMVMRLDAPQPGMVKEIILASLRAERDGLKGRVVLDSRGLARRDDDKPGSYAWYDQSIRNLAEIIRTKTKLSLLHDESPGVLPANSAQQVALYCGWYSVRNYVPSCSFVPGAVGFHIASFELVSLRDPNERGWVKGMINDGVAATAGAVAEPFLHAFPLADEFFPLLLTGELTLAEVYWRTTPMTSWMIAAVGDPLYRPFAANPQIKTEDLPERLQHLFTPQPATRPATP